MKIVIGNLLTQTDVPNIAHGANCFCRMGAGVAKGIVALYPDAYEADKATKAGCLHKLGSYSVADCGDKTVYNVYSQYGHDPKTKPIEYGSLFNGLWTVCQHLSNNNKGNLAIPYLMGCGLAGGDWNIVEEIIHKVEAMINETCPDFEIICYDLDGLSLYF